VGGLILNKVVSQIATGDLHLLVLTADNQLYGQFNIKSLTFM
jgi:hypothetical protein